MFCVFVFIACSNQLIKKHHLLDTVCFVSSLKIKLNDFDMSVFVCTVYIVVYMCASTFVCVCICMCSNIIYTHTKSS